MPELYCQFHGPQTPKHLPLGPLEAQNHKSRLSDSRSAFRALLALPQQHAAPASVVSAI
jgi:hypothetical protein